MITSDFPIDSWDCPIPTESTKGIQGLCFANTLHPQERGIDVAKLDEWGQQIQEQVPDRSEIWNYWPWAVEDQVLSHST